MVVSPKPDRCAVIVTDNWGRPADNCDQPATVAAVWRFEAHQASILLCDPHAAELAGNERLSLA